MGIKTHQELKEAVVKAIKLSDVPILTDFRSGCQCHRVPDSRKIMFYANRCIGDIGGGQILVQQFYGSPTIDERVSINIGLQNPPIMDKTELSVLVRALSKAGISANYDAANPQPTAISFETTPQKEAVIAALCAYFSSQRTIMTARIKYQHKLEYLANNGPLTKKKNNKTK